MMLELGSVVQVGHDRQGLGARYRILEFGSCLNSPLLVELLPSAAAAAAAPTHSSCCRVDIEPSHPTARIEIKYLNIKFTHYN